MSAKMTGRYGHDLYVFDGHYFEIIPEDTLSLAIAGINHLDNCCPNRSVSSRLIEICNMWRSNNLGLEFDEFIIKLGAERVLLD